MDSSFHVDWSRSNFKFGFGKVAAVDEDVSTNLFIEGSLAAALTAFRVPLTTVGMAE